MTDSDPTSQPQCPTRSDIYKPHPEIRDAWSQNLLTLSSIRVALEKIHHPTDRNVGSTRLITISDSLKVSLLWILNNMSDDDLYWYHLAGSVIVNWIFVATAEIISPRVESSL